jgi:hypothetical protein
MFSFFYFSQKKDGIHVGRVDSEDVWFGPQIVTSQVQHATKCGACSCRQTFGGKKIWKTVAW